MWARMTPESSGGRAGVCAIRVSTELGIFLTARCSCICALWNRRFKVPGEADPSSPVLQGNKSHTMQECGCVCQQSAFSAWELSAKISRGIGKLSFESTSLLFVRDSSFHMDAMFHCVSCIIYIQNFILIFLILSFPVVGIFFLSFSGQVIHMLIEICLLFEA